ncbi:MAG: hypothetical protein ACK47B_26410 [Armatimonadota bacterium]
MIRPFRIPSRAVAPVVLIAAILIAACGGARDSAAADDFLTEIKLAVDTAALPPEQRGKALKPEELKRIEEVLTKRLPIFAEMGGTVTAGSPTEIVVKAPSSAVSPDQLEFLRRQGLLEMRELKDLRTGIGSSDRYLLEVRRVEGGRESETSLRFRDTRSNRTLSVEEFLERCPRVADNSDLEPGTARLVSSGVLMAVRVELSQRATRRLSGFYKRPGRLLGVVLDGELVALNGALQPPPPKRKRKKGEPRAEGEERDEREDEQRAQTDIMGGFGSEREARYLALVFNSGPLPRPLKVVSTKIIAE